MDDETKLTEEEAQAMLARLSKHYHQPVMPANRFCRAFTTWFQCIRDGIEAGGSHGSGYAHMLDAIERDIRKSNLLARLIYGGEEMRTKKCPEHQGQWSGIGPCEHGCDSTGWVPDDWPDKAPRCTVHSDRPAVASSYSVAHGREYICWGCYTKRWR